MVPQKEGTMVDFTLADLARVLREVAAERPDYVYEPPNGGADCWYSHGSKPGCIFGHAFDRLGIADLSQFETKPVDYILSQMFGRPQESLLFRPFTNVQQAQDGAVGRARKPWGECVKALDEEYPL